MTLVMIDEMDALLQRWSGGQVALLSLPLSFSLPHTLTLSLSLSPPRSLSLSLTHTHTWNDAGDDGRDGYPAAARVGRTGSLASSH